MSACQDIIDRFQFEYETNGKMPTTYAAKDRREWWDICNSFTYDKIENGPLFTLHGVGRVKFLPPKEEA